MSILLPRSANTTYPVALAAAYASGAWWLYDPDYALSKDPEFYEKSQRDPVVAHAMQMRRHIVAGRSWNMVAGGARPEDKMLAALVEDLMKRRFRLFTAARYQLASAVFRGSAWGRIYGRRERFAAGGRKPQNWWVPTTIDAVDKRRVRRRVEGGKVILDVWPVALSGGPVMQAFQWEPVQHSEWMVFHSYNDDESSLGYGRGLSEALYEYMRAKAALLTYMLQACERFGPGILKFKMDTQASNLGGKTQEQAANDAIAVLRKMRAEGIIALDARDEAEIMEGSSTGWGMITQALAYLDNAIRTLLLGANLPTQATSGGSYAMAEVQENSTEALVQYDREILAESIDRDLVGLIMRVNAPQIAAVGLAGAERPKFAILDEKRADPEVAARVAQTLLAAGIPLRKDEVYERVGYSVPGPEDEVIDPRAAVAGEGGLEDLLQSGESGAPKPEDSANAPEPRAAPALTPDPSATPGPEKAAEVA